MKKGLLLSLIIISTLTVFSQDFSNKGKDFYLCFPSHVPSGASLAQMSLFITSDKNSAGVVTYNGQTQNFTVLANQVTEVAINRAAAYITDAESGAPVNKGIRVKVNTGQPAIVVYSHIYAGFRTAATLVLPVNVLGRKYRAISYFQQSTGGSKSQFQIVAVDTNTVVQIQLRKNGALSGTPFTITLPNIGDVWQIQDNLDLSGTYIESIALANGTCKKIAVFSGSSALSLSRFNCTGGSFDPLNQQCYPISTWGKNFGVIPIVNNQLGYQARVMASENATNISYGGTLVTLNAGEVFPAVSNTVVAQTQPIFITADKPIAVSQYLMSQDCAASPAIGDPDMIILNPIEQNIKDVTLFTSTKQSILQQHMNVLIKTVAVPSFKIKDALGNIVPTNIFSLMPGDPTYSYVQHTFTPVTQTSYTLTADSGFNVICYGLGSAESYGYSGGTNVKDLYQQIGIISQYGIEPTPSACLNSPFKFKVSLPYQPDSLYWDFNGAVSYTPAGNIWQTGPLNAGGRLQEDSSTFVNGKQIFWYSLPAIYTFTANGLFPITITAYTANADGCGNTQDIDFELEVSSPPTADFTWVNNGCVTDSVRFSDNTVTVKPTYKWWWDFGEPSSGVNNNSTLKNPIHKYALPGTYTIRYSNITTPGCLSDTVSKQVTVTLVPSANFGMSSPICQGVPVVFSDTSVAQAPGVLAKWYWDFGNGTIITRTNGSDTSITYNTWAPTVTDSLYVETNSGCKSPAFVRTFKVNSIPVSNFTMPAGVCLPGGAAQFTATSTNADPTAQAMTYAWNFDDPAANAGNPNTGTGSPISHFFDAANLPYDIVLRTTSPEGCFHDTTKQFTNVFPQADGAFTPPAPVCLGTIMNFTSSSNPLAGNTVTTYYWDFGDATGVQNSATANISHTYTTANTFTVLHWIVTDKGCNSDTASNTVTVNVIPSITSVALTNPTSCLGNEGFITLNGLLPGQSYTVNYDKNGIPQPLLTIVANATGQVIIPSLTAGTYTNINCTANNCTSPNAATQVLTDPPLPAAPTPGSNGPICAGSTLNLTASNIAGASGYSWTGPNGFTSALQNPSIVAATIAATGIYNVTVTVNNCTSLLSVPLNVVVNELPVISNVVPTNPTTCAGTDGFITLSGLTPGNTYAVNYLKNGLPQPVLNLTASATGQIVIPNLSSGTYANINCTINSCTSANAATQVLSDPSAPAPPTTGSNSPICAGTTLNLNASAVANGNYTWSGPNGFSSLVQNPSIIGATVAASGNYIVTVTVNNCTSASSIPLAVVVNVTPAISSAVPSNPTSCLGNEGFITLNGLLAGQTYTVNYSKNAIPQTALSLTANASGQVIIPTLTAGSYSNINCTANGCTSPNAATQVLTDPPLPAAPTPGSNGPICAGSTLNLTASTLAGASGYNWTGPNSFTSALQNPSIVSATTAATGNYFVTVTLNNCTSLPSVALNVLVNDMPVISGVASTNPTACSGSDGTITLSGLIPGQTYSVNYNKNAVPQTALSLTASAGGTVVITSLTAGTYSNINCTANNCTSANAATQILSDPNPPAAPVGNSNTPICSGATLNLTANPVAGGTFAWAGPNGFASALQNPSIVNATTAASGNYSVTVTVANCVSAATIVPVVVNPLPSGNFSFTTPSCETRTIAFSDLSVANVGTVGSWAWNFGDPGSGANNTSALQNPTHDFATSGSYTVTLTVTNSTGCVSAVYSAPVVINARPAAGFILPEVCLSDTYAQFNDTSKVTVGTITGWEWDFGDINATAPNPNISLLQNPQHSYTAVGNYNVRLIVTTNTGCKDTITQVLTVNGSFPIAGFTINNAASLCANDSVSIVNTSTVFPGVITKVEIYWDNINFPGVFQTDNAPLPNKVYTHLYPNFQAPLVKPFTIRFRAYSGGVCVNDRIQIINVNAAPKVQFNAIPNTCLDAAPFVITQASEIGGVPGSFVFSGPGVNATGTFSPALVGPGTYTIKYTYTSAAGGCIDSASKQITVLAPPVADFSVSALTCEDVAITFTDASNTPVGTLTTWTWDFGDGTPQFITNSPAPLNHTFANWGNYNVTLRVTTSDGCISPVKLIPVAVKPTPKPDFTFPASVCLPNANVTFNNTSTIADGTENQFTYVWDFGDLSAANLSKNPSHQYSGIGPYTVNLEVTSGAGCINDTDIVLNIIHPQPKADFSINKPAICIGDNVTFTDASDGKDGVVNQWNWALGDGSVRNVPGFTYTYNTAATFNVSLYVVNSQGCNSDTLTKQFTVHPYPVVSAGPDKVVLEGGAVSLTPNVTGNDLQYLWTPALYLNSNVNPSPVASNLLSDITYTLTVTARGGCSRSDQVFVRLLKAPKIPNTFTPNNDGINDFWTIEYLNTYPDNRVQVFTRTGQLVFESRGYNKPWDGTKNGKPLPFDTYYYIIEPNNGRKPITGYVTIVK